MLLLVHPPVVDPNSFPERDAVIFRRLLPLCLAVVVGCTRDKRLIRCIRRESTGTLGSSAIFTLAH